MDTKRAQEGDNGTRTVAYLRVSTEKQAEHGVSIDAQRAKVAMYGELYGLDLVAVEVEAGESAKTMRARGCSWREAVAVRRPALHRALSMLEAGEADALLVFRLDRLTRSLRDLNEMLDRYFAAGHLGLMSVTEQIDTRSAAGRMVINVVASINQWQREDISEKTAEAMAHKKSRHEYTGGRVPYGWTLTADGVHVEPCEAEQAVIKIALDLKAAGLSLRKIAADLAEQDLLPRSGGKWHPKTVSGLLKAEVAA